MKKRKRDEIIKSKRKNAKQIKITNRAKLKASLIKTIKKEGRCYTMFCGRDCPFGKAPELCQRLIQPKSTEEEVNLICETRYHNAIYLFVKAFGKEALVEELL